jgi:ligand-binding SRPBCC domain-containing protein
MIWSRQVTVSAPPEVVWSVYSDVERWPTWTASVTSVEPLDGRDIELGRRFRIKQPRLPVLVWQVTDTRPGRSWRWTATSAGMTTVAWHEVLPDGEGSAVVAQGVDQRGPLSAVVGLVMGRLTRRYLALEGEGIKRASEERARGGRQR